MARVSPLFDAWGVIYDAAKRLPTKELKVGFLEALAELEDYECHRTLNSPNSENVRTLSKQYLGEDLTNRWRWERTTPLLAAKRLDSLIRLRGYLAHRGREAFKRAAVIQRKQVIEAISLLTHLVDCTERALGTAPRAL